MCRTRPLIEEEGGRGEAGKKLSIDNFEDTLEQLSFRLRTKIFNRFTRLYTT